MTGAQYLMVSPGSSLVVRGQAFAREQAGGVTTLHSRFHGYKRKEFNKSMATAVQWLELISMLMSKK